MRKIFTLAASLAATLTFAQETTKQHQVSINPMFSDPSQIGLQYEYKIKPDGKHAKSHIVNVAAGLMNYSVAGYDIDGTGFAIELGSRNYWGPEHKGFYGANYLSYGNVKFDENLFIFGVVDGTYSYFSFFAPEIGYKIQLGNFSIDPFIGAMWKIEIKGKGDIDNKNVDEWAVRTGVKFGYSF
ncbi:hypothetical protein GR160_03045 [Flavobacterium sp. Sd200]|uniref:autotransporter outer membrane beta-barrel domain-containing protein n=1 Tax=Flavobacterium sp. Sd200 TaxID=2692211 RepID=UPI00136938C6|nr:autotransporter outer membrane beta-barrel domain-containing protein [Flavobacterium sp. Sd200]MXN90191.1 hypothetical protein [Flavobacterium sp. Sd200]